LEANIQLGLHEFLRYSIPGYIYLLVFFLPNRTLIESNSLFSSALLVLAGPILGDILFHIYYPIFMHFSYDTAETRPFSYIRTEVTRKVNDRSSKEIEILTRAIEDFAFHDPYLRRFEKERERIQFLFSSFHSIGATIVAICSGIISLVIWEAISKMQLGGGLLVVLPIPIGCRILQFAISPICWSVANFSSFFAIWLIFWIFLSFHLFEGWAYRKDLAIMEEFLLVTQNKWKLDSIINDAISAFTDQKFDP
jgi:hypothetical protein